MSFPNQQKIAQQTFDQDLVMRSISKLGWPLTQGYSASVIDRESSDVTAPSRSAQASLPTAKNVYRLDQTIAILSFDMLRSLESECLNRLVSHHAAIIGRTRANMA